MLLCVHTECGKFMWKRSIIDLYSQLLLSSTTALGLWVFCLQLFLLLLASSPSSSPSLCAPFHRHFLPFFFAFIWWKFNLSTQCFSIFSLTHTQFLSNLFSVSSPHKPKNIDYQHPKNIWLSCGDHSSYANLQVLNDSAHTCCITLFLQKHVTCLFIIRAEIQKVFERFSWLVRACFSGRFSCICFSFNGENERMKTFEKPEIAEETENSRVGLSFNFCFAYL